MFLPEASTGVCSFECTVTLIGWQFGVSTKMVISTKPSLSLATYLVRLNVTRLPVEKYSDTITSS